MSASSQFSFTFARFGVSINGVARISVVLGSIVLGACSSSGGADFDFGYSLENEDVVDVTDEVTDTVTDEVTDEVTSGFVPSEIIGAAQIDVMQGQWVTGCLQTAENTFQTAELSVVGPRLILNFARFDDQQCTSPTAVNAQLSGSTVQFEATTVPTGASVETSLGTAAAVDFHFEQATVDNRPIPDEDFSDRELFLAHIDYNIVFEQNGNLYFGDTGITGFDGTSPESRPQTLDFLGVFTQAP